LKRVVGVIAAGAFLAAGCASQPQAERLHSQVLAVAPTPAPPPANTAVSPAVDPPAPAPSTDSRIIARVNGQPITLHDLLEPLMASRGLALLLNLAQLDLAKQDARAVHVAVTPDDVKREQEITLDKLFHDRDQKDQDRLTDAELKKDAVKAGQIRAQMRDDREKFLLQYLDTQHVSRFEYDIIIELNAYLRKAAEVQLKGKITDEMVEKQFGLEYGETASCRVIQLSNAREVQEAQRRLQAKEDFADVARAMSHNPRTAPLGGEMPAFSLQTQGLPKEFRELAFSLQPGQVSDMLVLGDNYYLIKLEQKFAPKAVKFADVKEILRKDMYDKLTENVMGELRENLGQQIFQQLTITEPALARQFDDLKAKREGAVKDREKMNAQWKQEHEAAAAAAATQSALPPGPTTAPAPASAPATRPGAL
jgi:foldase protein PrsA